MVIFDCVFDQTSYDYVFPWMIETYAFDLPGDVWLELVLIQVLPMVLEDKYHYYILLDVFLNGNNQNNLCLINL